MFQRRQCFNEIKFITVAFAIFFHKSPVSMDIRTRHNYRFAKKFAACAQLTLIADIHICHSIYRTITS